METITYAKTKTVLLSLSALLIGGLGCSAIDATNIAIESAQHNKAAAALKTQQEQHFKDIAKTAEKGDLAAMTELGIEHLSNSPFLVADKQKGKTLIEQAATQGFAAAEYYLGIQLARVEAPASDLHTIMIPGNFSHDLKNVFSADPGNAEKYLKKSAQHACTITFTESQKDGFSNTESNAPTKVSVNIVKPALFISVFYKPDDYDTGQKKLLPSNEEQYELWFARSILHCNFPHTPGFDSFWQTDSDNTEQQILNLAFLRLTPTEYWNFYYDELLKKMPAESIKAADIKAQALRQTVKRSEQEYPAPKMATTEKNDIIENGKNKLRSSYEASLYERRSDKNFIETTSQFLQYSQYIQDYSSSISQYTNALLINYLKHEKEQMPSPEKIAAAKKLLDFYIDQVFPVTGKNSANDHLYVASTGLIISVQTKNTAIATKVFNQLLGGKSFNINQVSNDNLVYNIACYYAINHRKSDLLKAAKKLAETPQQVDRILGDEDLKDYVNDAEVLAAFGR